MHSLSTSLRGYLIDLWDDYGMPSVILSLLFLGLGVGNIIHQYQSTRSASGDNPIIVIATAALPTLWSETSQRPPLAKSAIARVSVTGLVFQRAIIVYDAPGGKAIGPVEPGRSYILVARAGSEWVQANVAGSGQVWVRAIDLTGAPDLPDIATPVPPPTFVKSEAPLPTRDAPIFAPDSVAATPAWPALSTHTPTTDVPPGDGNEAVTTVPDVVQPSPTFDTDAWQRLQERNDERRALKSVDDPTPTQRPAQ